jgi:hypothetical protein
VIPLHHELTWRDPRLLETVELLHALWDLEYLLEAAKEQVLLVEEEMLNRRDVDESFRPRHLDRGQIV